MGELTRLFACATVATFTATVPPTTPVIAVAFSTTAAVTAAAHTQLTTVDGVELTAVLGRVSAESALRAELTILATILAWRELAGFSLTGRFWRRRIGHNRCHRRRCRQLRPAVPEAIARLCIGCTVTTETLTVIATACETLAARLTITTRTSVTWSTAGLFRRDLVRLLRRRRGESAPCPDLTQAGTVFF